MKGKGLTALRMLAGEIGLVKRGANKKKRFPITKSEDNMDMTEAIKVVLESEAEGEEELDKVLKALDLSEQGMAAAKGAHRLLKAFEDELPAGLVDKLAELAGMKKQKEKEMDEEYKYPEAKKDEIKKWFEGIPDEVKKFVKFEEPVEPVQKGLEDMDEESKSKVEEILKSRDDKISELEKKNEELEKSQKAERDERELKDWIAKAEKDLSHYPGKSIEELGKDLKKLHDFDPDMATVQFEQMKTASETIKKSALLSEVGNKFPDMVGAGKSAWDEIVKLAESEIQKSDDLKFSREHAIKKVIEARPDLYNRYLEEHPDQIKG
ncbi:MAG: hypothetical protein GWM98_04775 [Nitrospinaceae bacterium]|nr:hypothetical protein [Deltaproteobacteria bacterium]NIY14234.1 hypothetical protein [Nitrospinaceae bacterium]